MMRDLLKQLRDILVVGFKALIGEESQLRKQRLEQPNIAEEIVYETEGGDIEAYSGEVSE